MRAGGQINRDVLRKKPTNKQHGTRRNNAARARSARADSG
jgi:hypothetical protein